MDSRRSTASAEKLSELVQHLGQVIRGKDEVLEMLVVAMLANGSVLMEDVPGVGKTTLAKALAKSIDLNFNRVQFTPDLLPVSYTHLTLPTICSV